MVHLKGVTRLTSEAEVLFYGRYTSSAALEGQPRALADAIEKYDQDAILTANIDELVTYFVDKFRIDVPRLHEDEITVSQRDEQYDARRDPNRVIFDESRPVYVPGTRFTFHVPYDGETPLFQMRANTFTVNPPRAVVTQTELQFPYTTADANDAPRLKDQFERELAKVREHLAWLQNDLRPFMDGLPALARQLIEKRRQKLTADRGVVANLGYKVRERSDAPKTYSVPTQRREIRAPTAPRGRVGGALEPALDDATYDRILEICSDMARVLEQSPAMFAKLSEPDIRNHFLVQLNGQFKGSATGETFNAEGKTDILVKNDGKNIFIGECKFWDGPKSITDAVDQLLSYTTWRDSKLALFVFSKGADFTEVLRKINNTVGEHPAVVRRVGAAGETGFRYILARPDDQERQMTLAILAFAVPQAKPRKSA